MKLKIPLVCLICITSAIGYADQVGTAFTYQGQLSVSGAPANGAYDFIFALYDHASSGNEIGNPVVTNGLSVSNGLLNTTLDFGSQFNGAASWLAISVRTNNSGNYSVLAPRQAPTPTPNALFAIDAATATTVANGGVLSASIGSGQVVKSLNGLQDSVTLAQGNNVTITPNGNTLTIAATSGGAGWSLTGNSGTAAGANFVGTSDNQPLELHVNGVRALRLEPDTSDDGAPNVIGGSPGNFAAVSIEGVFIGGGGTTNLRETGITYANSVSASFGTIGGGFGNGIQVGGDESVIAGGSENVIQGDSVAGSTICGGVGNSILGSASESSIAGGAGNVTQAGNSFIGNGFGNTIQAAAIYSTIGGGQYNTNGGQYATVPGGYGNAALGDWSFAAGDNARAINRGSFVWADSYTPNPFLSTADNQVSFRCNGGVLFTSGSGASDQAVSWTPGSASWSFSSDRNLKDRFSPVESQAVLDKVCQLPLREWSYKGYSQRHIGPMAQDFHALFPFNENDKMLDDADLHGVELAAIQGLDQEVDERMKAKDAQIQKLQQTVTQLQDIVSKLVESQKQAEEK